MFDLKVINSVLSEMEDERGVSREKMLDAIEQALATAYKKEYGKRGQIIRTEFDMDSGTTTFSQIKTVVDESMLKPEREEVEEEEVPTEDEEVTEDGRVRFDPEKHIMLDTARLMKKDVAVGDELVFPLESKDDFGRIAAQTAKQVIIQKVREAEKESALAEYGQKEGDIVLGHVQRFERGNLYVDLGRVTGVMPYDEQIPGERFKPGERIRVLLLEVDETARGVYLRLSRAHPDFLTSLFAIEAPELQTGAVEIKAIAREAGARTKVAVYAHDEHIDPVGSLVGQRGVRVSTVMSELGGEKIDIIEWSEDPITFIEDALSPAQVLSVTIEHEPGENDDDARGHAIVEVSPDQQSLAIGRGGQNVRLAAKLTGWKIDIVSAKGEQLAEADETGNVELEAAPSTEFGADAEVLEGEDPSTSKEEPASEDEPTADRDALGLAEEDAVDTPEEAEDQLEEGKAATEIEADENTTDPDPAEEVTRDEAEEPTGEDAKKS